MVKAKAEDTDSKVAVAKGAKDDKLAQMQRTLDEIIKKHGKGSVGLLGGGGVAAEKMPVISTGSLAIDLALGVGGLPKGRIIEIYGPESSGKTTFCSSVIAQAQKAGGICAFIDTENAYDPAFAQVLGVDTDKLYFSQPDNGEQALSIADEYIRSGVVDVLVIDSVAALVPKKEIEGEMGDSHVGLQARLMSQGLRKLTSSVSKTGTILIFTNQLREKIGVMFGSPETTTGGKALKFYASVRIDVRKKEALKDGETNIGFKTNFKIVKNKVAPPMKVAATAIYFNEGFSKSMEILELGILYGIISKAGASIRIEGQQNIQGQAKAKAFLDANLDVRDKLEAQIREYVAADVGRSRLIAGPIASDAGGSEAEDSE